MHILNAPHFEVHDLDWADSEAVRAGGPSGVGGLGGSGIRQALLEAK